MERWWGRGGSTSGVRGIGSRKGGGDMAASIARTGKVGETVKKVKKKDEVPTKKDDCVEDQRIQRNQT